MEHGWAHYHCGGRRGRRVLRTTATVLLVRMTSKGRQMYIAAFIRLKPDITVIMAPVMTRGRSRSGCAMSPSTKPTCYASRCQNSSIIPSCSLWVDVSSLRFPSPEPSPLVECVCVWGGGGWFHTVSQPP